MNCAVDTATEVALLAISAAAPGQGIPIYWILLLPSLFTAAMAMIDTLDGILMVSSHVSVAVLLLVSEVVVRSCSYGHTAGRSLIQIGSWATTSLVRTDAYWPGAQKSAWALHLTLHVCTRQHLTADEN